LIRETGRLLDIPWERTVSVVDRYANSSAASIPIALAEAIRRGNIERDNLLLLTAVGAGLTSAAIVLKW
jgi:3-oxoacyl-[acyl-carrier-protein] synthase-3